MIKNYILMLGIAGVALGSYAAYAGNSATMTVTATIVHDVSLVATSPLNMGTLTIDPSNIEEAQIYISSNGSILGKNGGIISLTGFSAGTFTANVPDSCKVSNFADSRTADHHPCFEADTELYFGNTIIYEPSVEYISGNTFSFMYDFWNYGPGVVPTSGDYSGSITIKYVL
ncbi:MAG: hypothetical protein IJ689_03840 [Alphaproteobacteria bacterium]|nr:hypothetical protein [Alphaproteobacteria bacterium]